MKLLKKTQDFRQQHNRCVATIGKFDGVHRGHQAIVLQLLAEAAAHSVPAVVIIIEPHPEEFFAGPGDVGPARLTEIDEKLALLAALNVDFIYCLRFDHALSQLSAEEYIEQILVDGLGIKSLIAGSDFRFGHQRRGDFAMLQRYGARFDFSVIKTTSYCHQGQRVSSTMVREVLEAGDFALCAQLLGRDYAIAGEVVYGRQLGRTLGFPTCNVMLRRRSLPLHGVYACQVELADGSHHHAAANIGYRPTVQGTAASTDLQAVLEVHLLDFAGDLYGHRIVCRFRHRIRAEQQFADVAALQQQIALDVSAARQWFTGQQKRSAQC